VSRSMTGDGNLLKPCREDVSQICLGVAERWQPNPASTEYTFKIRDNVLWHDGKPFSAEDVKFWFDLGYFGVKAGDKVRGPARAKAEMGDIKEVTVLPGNQVRVTLTGSDPLWASKLAQIDVQGGMGSIWHPKHLMQPRIDQGEVNVAPQEVGFVGIGPFKMDRYEKGSVIQVRRFEQYWEKDEKGRPMPYLDGVDFPIITDPTAMDAAFRTGRLDGTGRGAGFYFTTERYEALKSAMGDRLYFAQIEGAVRGMTITVIRPGPWQDARVRQALGLWVNKQEMVEAIQGGPCCGLMHPGISPNSPWPDPDWRAWPGFNPATKEADRAKAKQLLSQAGYPNGFEMGLMCRRQWLFRCEPYIAELAKLGVRLNLDIVDDADWTRKFIAAQYDMEITASPWEFDPGIGPEMIESKLYRYSVEPSATMKHEDPKVEGYFQRLKAVQGNQEDRIKIWRELERYLVLEQAYFVPGEAELALMAYRTYLKGLYIPSRGRNNNMDLATVWLDK